MADPPATAPPRVEPAPEDRLDSWKEIAAYLKRDVTTVQRWEKREAMPVRRHVHDKIGSVYAFRSELDAWSSSRHPLGAEEPRPHPPALDPLPASASPRPGVGHLTGLLMASAIFLALAMAWWFAARSPATWHDPLTNAQFHTITDFDGSEHAAAVSRDGRLVAFLSDRDGQMDVWVTQIGAGQFYNLTRGRAHDLVNPSVRTLGFSPDGAFVTYWARGNEGSTPADINVWAVPTLGGLPRPYLEGAAEFDWSRDGSRLVYHTPGPGDPTFITQPNKDAAERIFSASLGLHAHFPTWSPDDVFIYFVQGAAPDAMDLWRIKATGGSAERLTSHNSRVSHPVWLNDRQLLYLASDPDGGGPWLHSLDVDRRETHRVGAGLSRYTSLSATGDGRRLVATLASQKGSFWRVSLEGDAPITSEATRMTLSTGRGFSPRLGPGYLLYVLANATGDGIWKVVDGSTTEIWRNDGARIIGGPEIAPDGRRIAFSVEQRTKRALLIMNADGTNARVVTDSLELRGAPGWSADGTTIASGVIVDGTPELFRISLDGKTTSLTHEYAVDPVWSPAGDFVLYSGADVGTTFPVKAVSGSTGPYPIAALSLTRGARRLRFLPGRRAVVAMRGEVEHKDLWLIDLESGAQRQLTRLPPDFTIRDFDVSADGRDIVLERVQDPSDIVLIEMPGS